ncbi:UNVERIFIED_CONTAM: hypothetical protein Slati_2763700 [Sesamum latifolium]|uniref:Uncharacterized protein n=1 Tax=Sesamum latifolium TaxID=2727402 RepID=A0AAW2VZ46_9LAMI
MFSTVNMFNQLLQDKALSEGKVPGTGSSSERPSAKTHYSTPASSASTADPKGKRQAKSVSTFVKLAKVSTGPLAPLAPKPSTCAGTPRLANKKIKREKLDIDEASSLLMEEVYLEALPRDWAMSSLASHISKAVILAGELFSWLEQGGSAAKEA